MTTFRSAFDGPQDETNGSGKRPVVFDIVGPDRVTSLLPEDLRMVLHVNPATMSITYQKVIEYTQTLGGYVEQYFGDGPAEVSFSGSSGGFMRLGTGLTSVTGPGPVNHLVRSPAQSLGGTRRETIAYDKLLDLLALYKSNGAVYDSNGQIYAQGLVKMHFDGVQWYGTFGSFSVTESAEKPFMFEFTASFTVHFEAHTLKSMRSVSSDFLF